MSALFISHSSADNAAAAELMARLARMGHRSVFLDFHPEQGIPAGRQWERELYAQLRACEAVVVLCSPASMASPWCFAEITHARALGKPVFPLRIAEGAVSALLGDVQIVDLTRDPEQGYARLAAGLAAAGLDPAGMFDWDGSRAPYPGLLAFQKADAAVYFGRDAAIQSTRETLNRLQRLGGARLVVVLGASGSGKSSLMRAGVVPRLQRERDRWLVAEPFRPLSRPFDGLAMALAGIVEGTDWQLARETLKGEDDGWRDLVNALRRLAGAPEATVLVVIDQFEELLTRAQDDESAAFMARLRAMTSEPDGPLLCVATLRSDFLGALQTAPALQGLPHEPVMLGPIAPAELAQVVEGPARVAGVELEPGLASAMVADTAADDALPLLAFALRELWDRHGAGGSLRLEHYRTLGGLQGALARAAEAVCEAEKLDATQFDRLRQALLRLVRVDAEGRFVRQPRPWSDLPAAVHPLLERFVQARLLVSRGETDGTRVLEVAHEALLRSWDRLVVWLNADRDFLLWRERLRVAGGEWRRLAKDPGLALRGPLLDEAKRWLAERGDDLDVEAREFIAASIASHETERATHQRRRRRQAIAGGIAVLLIGITAVLAVYQSRQADVERRLAHARELNDKAEAARDDDLVQSLRLTLQSARQAWTPESHAALLGAVGVLARPLPARWKPHHGPVRAMALSPDGRWLATAGQGRLQVQAASGEVFELQPPNGHHYVQAVAFSPDGRWLAAACAEPELCIYDLQDLGSGQPVRQWPLGEGIVAAVAFSPDGRSLAAASYTSPAVHLFSVGDWTPQATIPTGVDRAWGLAFNPAGLLAVTGESTELWSVAPPQGRRLGAAPGVMGKSVAFGAEGRLLAVGGERGDVKLFELAAAADGSVTMTEKPVSLPGGHFGRLGFGPDGRYLAATDERGGVRIADLANGGPPGAAPDPAGAVVFTGERRLLAGGMDGRIVEWDADAQARIGLPPGALRTVALSDDSRWLAAAAGGEVSVLETRDGSRVASIRLEEEDTDFLAFSPDARWLAAVAAKNLWLIDTVAWRAKGPYAHDERVRGVAFPPTGDRVATTAHWDGFRVWIDRQNAARLLRVWDIAGGTELARSFVVALDPLHDNGVIAAPRNEEEIAAGRPVAGGDAALAAEAIRWSATSRTPGGPAQGRLAAQTADGGTVAAKAADVARQSHGTASPQIVFGADGRLLVSASERDLRIWPLSAEDLIAEVCARLPGVEECRE